MYCSCFYLRPIHRSHLMLKAALHSSTRDEKPLVNARINRSRRQIVSLRDGRNLVWVDMAGRTGNSQIGTTKFLSVRAFEEKRIYGRGLYRDMLLGSLWPEMSSSHAPLHSRMTSVAYLVPACQKILRGEPRWILPTFCSCIHQRMQIGSQAFHPGSCRCETTRWWPSRDREDGARHPQYLNNKIITSHR